MKYSWCPLLLCLFAAATSAPAMERLPIEDFAREPEVSRARLSPDGKYFAYLGEHRGIIKLHVGEVTRNNVLRLNIGGAGQNPESGGSGAARHDQFSGR